MKGHGQRILKNYFGHLVHMMEINPRRNVFEGLIDAWDRHNNVYHFSNFEMTPTLEELARCMGV